MGSQSGEHRLHRQEFGVSPGRVPHQWGIGSAEPGFNTTGTFGSLFGWINAQQQGFYRLMTGALKDDGPRMWAKVSVSPASSRIRIAVPA